MSGWKGSPDEGGLAGLAWPGQGDNLEFLRESNGFGCQGSFDHESAPFAGEWFNYYYHNIYCTNMQFICRIVQCRIELKL
jgi:hypothetical protein